MEPQQTPQKVESPELASTPSDEIEMLQQRVEVREAMAPTQEAVPSVERERVISEELEKYKNEKPGESIDPDYEMKVDQIEREVLKFSESHEQEVDKLIDVMEEKGIKNALAVAAALNNPHYEDDFHRFLVAYLAEGLSARGLKQESRLFRALDRTLYQITLPEPDTGSGDSVFAQVVTQMMQFYEGMLSLGVEKKREAVLTLELALSRFTNEIVFYAAIPNKSRSLFEKQLLGAFPDASITALRDDYNPFNSEGVTVGAVAKLEDVRAYPIRTYEDFEQDPLKTMLNVFTSLDRDDEGAVIQLLFAPPARADTINKEYAEILKRAEDGEDIKSASASKLKRFSTEAKSIAKEILTGKIKEKKESIEVDHSSIELLKSKMELPIVETNLRIITSAKEKVRAESILEDIESSFNQFAKPQANAFKFSQVGGKKLKEMLHHFSFRMLDPSNIIELNLKEITTVFHLPMTELGSSQLKQSDIMMAPPPAGMDPEGILLGENNYRGTKSMVHMAKEDRVRHTYVIGQTGTGKSVLLKNMVVQDIRNGEGVCYMDPHGSDLIDILNAVPPERAKDVIFFDPSDMARPMGLNMLEYDPAKPEQKTFVVNEMLSIFNKLFDMKVAGGPMFEQYFRNATMLVIEDPATGSSLIDVARVLTDENFRKLKISRCKNPLVVQFWEEVAQKAGGESSLANMVPYITNKFDVFLSNDIMRLIVSQEKSAFNFRELMDNRKILLVNLAKGKLGDINSNLIGLILVGKILMAALSRVDAHGQKLPDFYLYIDEFQNVTTDSISAILSEARKYRLSLNMAHQFIAQLDEGIRDSVFGNVGSMAVFRVGAEDAQFLESQFAPTFTAPDIMKIPNWNAYMKILVNGYPAKPFNIATLPPPDGDPVVGQQIKELSAQTYGVEKSEIEALISKKYEKSAQAKIAPKAPAKRPAQPGAQAKPGTKGKGVLGMNLKRPQRPQEPPRVEKTAGKHDIMNNVANVARQQTKPVMAASTQITNRQNNMQDTNQQPVGQGAPPNTQPQQAPAPAQPQTATPPQFIPQKEVDAPAATPAPAAPVQESASVPAVQTAIPSMQPQYKAPLGAAPASNIQLGENQPAPAAAPAPAPVVIPESQPAQAAPAPAQANTQPTPATPIPMAQSVPADSGQSSPENSNPTPAQDPNSNYGKKDESKADILAQKAALLQEEFEANAANAEGSDVKDPRFTENDRIGGTKEAYSATIPGAGTAIPAQPAQAAPSAPAVAPVGQPATQPTPAASPTPASTPTPPVVQPAGQPTPLPTQAPPVGGAGDAPANPTAQGPGYTGTDPYREPVE